MTIKMKHMRLLIIITLAVLSCLLLGLGYHGFYEKESTDNEDIRNPQYINAHPTEGIPTLYFEIKEEAIDVVNSSDYAVETSVKLFDEVGDLDFEGTGKIKRRGNTTKTRPKKPYLIELDESASLLSMTASSKWVLLANAYDSSNLRNKIAYDFAQKTNASWNPDSRFAEVFINGIYNGIYLLTEKIEAGENKVNIGEEGCLLELSPQSYNIPREKNAWVNEKVRAEICYPDVKKIDRDYTKQITDILCSIYNGDIEKIYGNIDVDSFARHFLIQEIFENQDMNRNSIYFYTESENPLVLYGGPIWDFDISMGLTDSEVISDPYSLRLYKKIYPNEKVKPLCKGLYEYPDFHERVVELYRTEYRDILVELSENGIDEYKRLYGEAIIKNNNLWEKVFPDKSRDFYTDCDYIKKYLKSRIEFLDSIWIDGSEYVPEEIKVEDTSKLPFYQSFMEYITLIVFICIMLIIAGIEINRHYREKKWQNSDMK